MRIDWQQQYESRTQVKRQSAFTLVELMIVVAVIGLLAAIAVPNFVRARKVSQGVRVANDLRVFANAFAIYAFEFGKYPPDSHEALPSVPEIDEYISESQFNSPTVLGGRYNWDGPDQYPYAGVSVSGASISAADLLQVDKTVDDGNLSTGHYRRTPNGRFTYIIEEQ